MTDKVCHICQKLKGQPPERCNGHYDTMADNPKPHVFLTQDEIAYIERWNAPSFDWAMRLLADLEAMRAAYAKVLEALGYTPTAPIAEVLCEIASLKAADAKFAVAVNAAARMQEERDEAVANSKSLESDLSASMKEYSEISIENERLRKVLVALVDKLDQIDAHPGTKAVYTTAFIHGCRYKGPNYEAELTEAKRASRDQYMADASSLGQEALQEENKRLRKALETIATGPPRGAAR